MLNFEESERKYGEGGYMLAFLAVTFTRRLIQCYSLRFYIQVLCYQWQPMISEYTRLHNLDVTFILHSAEDGGRK